MRPSTRLPWGWEGEHLERPPYRSLPAGCAHTWPRPATPSSCSLTFPFGQKGTGSPKRAGTSRRSLHPSLHCGRAGKGKGREEARPSPPPRAGGPQSGSYSRTACHVSKPKLTCFSGAPPPGPRRCPSGPSPSSVCEACLQRQQAQHTARGAPPMIALHESGRFLPLDAAPPIRCLHSLLPAPRIL